MTPIVRIDDYFLQLLAENKTRIKDGYCYHKSLFFPFKSMDVIGTFVLIVIMALATMGGIGGGGVVVLLI
jgi:hypothetical protein